MKKQINIAVIGAGGFAYFAVTEFVKIEGVQLKAVFDENLNNANRFKEIDASVEICTSMEALCNEPGIDLVYIATPPYLHYSQSKAALLAGKHVICEKPAAIRSEDAIALRKLAAEKQLLFVVNLMQRYNPLYDSIYQLIQQNILGSFLHGYFENYASDEFLPVNHWFWNEEKSGGIFIEHGVHFFDMFSGWLGEGKVIAAQKLQRPLNENIWDKVQATVLYEQGLVNFYHGFDQPKIMDRQEMRLQFEKGEITLFDWVPTRLKMTALCTEQELKQLQQLFPSAGIRIIEHFETLKVSDARFKKISYNYKLNLESNDSVQKQTLYQELVREMFADQFAWINDPAHIRKIDQDNAVNSLLMAENAERLAIKLGE